MVWLGRGESAVGSLGLLLYSVNDPPSRKEQKRLKDADKDYKDCLSILGNKWLLKSCKKKKKVCFDEYGIRESEAQEINTSEI